MTPFAHTVVRAVVFDLDDTLYLERDYVRSGYRAVGELLHRRFGAPLDVGEWMWRRFQVGNSANMFNAAGEQFDLALRDEQISELVAVYRDHWPDIEPLPDAVAALDALGGRVKLGLLSDGFLPAQRLKLEALDLAERFDAVVFTEESGRECWKPSPAGFERIASLLGIAHDACAYVADNPAKDFVAPNALGWLSVQWLRDGQVHADNPAPTGGTASMIVRSMKDLMAALKPGL